MKNIINIDNWHRKEHFLFFKNFDQPFFGITTNVDCTKAYLKAKENNIPFFILYLYCSLKAVNLTTEFKYRIENDNVVLYDVINASPTITRSNGTFGFAYLNYNDNFQEFIKEAEIEIEKVKNEATIKPATNNENVIHYSTIPWISFTSVSHSYHNAQKDSVPKIMFGKIFMEGDKKKMPVSIHANHALVDGYHVSQYLEIFQDLLDNLVI